MEIFKSHFGQKLTGLLKEQGKRQSWLAERLNIDPPNISRWANGLNFPDEENFKKLCVALNVSEEYFVSDFTNKSDLIVEIVRRLPALDELQLRSVLKLASTDESDSVINTTTKGSISSKVIK